MILIFHSFKGFSDLEDFWDDLPISRLKYNALDDFQEVFQTTSRKFFRSGFDMQIFSDLEDFWGELHVSRLKYNALDDFQEVFQTGLPGSLLTKSSSISNGVHVFHHMILIFHSFKGRSINFRYVFLFFRSGFGYEGFSDLEDFWDDLLVSRLKYKALDDFQEVFQTTSRKSSGLLGSLLTKSAFHNRSESFDFSDLEDFWDDLPVSLLKYNALDGFQEVVRTS
ncbi:hypothetical protein F2Q68_00038432 [Brassica cretica]|uniref:Uncharacterized protein n=1 Tax=Brassica cretica TaxID=69181 RepID=A0A8S9MHW2_BRACR|nr:hypothetical protein F2Q68_00038432 [Brassica cretica]